MGQWGAARARVSQNAGNATNRSRNAPVELGTEIVERSTKNRRLKNRALGEVDIDDSSRQRLPTLVVGWQSRVRELLRDVRAGAFPARMPIPARELRD
jgi:hypothetical protein